MAGDPKRPSIPQPSPRRACILDAADKLLRHYGVGKTTVADVAREAGVGVGTVYLEFSSKEVLVEEISRTRYLAVLCRMREAAAGDRPASARLVAALDARLSAFVALSSEGAHAGELMHCVNPAVKTAQTAFYEAELALVGEIVQAGAEAGELAAGDPGLTARTVLRAYATFSLPWLAGKDAAELARAQEGMHALVLQGLLRRAG